MAEIEIDSTNPHLWLIRFPVDINAEAYRKMVLDSISRNPNKIRYAVIMDMRSASAVGASSKGRQEAARIMKEHEPWLRAVVVCTVRVTPNPILRGALTVYDWITPSKWPRNSVANGRVAEIWARSKLETAGIVCAPEPVWRE